MIRPQRVTPTGDPNVLNWPQRVTQTGNMTTAIRRTFLDQVITAPYRPLTEKNRNPAKSNADWQTEKRQAEIAIFGLEAV